MCWAALVLTEHDLVVAGRNVESGALRIDLDHRAVLVATRRHEGTFERPERMALTAHQFGQDLGDMARLARRNRYVVDHFTSFPCRLVGEAEKRLPTPTVSPLRKCSSRSGRRTVISLLPATRWRVTG